MVWVATDKPPVMKVAVPPLKVAVPSAAELSLKVTIPVGVPEPGAFTVTIAVKVTGWPKTDGLLLELSVVVVGAWLPTCWSALDALVRKFPSPPYLALIE